MREIKFRAWDQKKKEMYFKAFYVRMCGMACDSMFQNISDEIEVMQYTGLKDKNGKEIYEGDILDLNAHIDGDFEYGSRPEIDLSFTGEVVILASKGVCLKNAKWENNLVTSKHGKYGKCSSYKPVSAYRSKIIGNKYENPELVDK